jgi:hypothetical protein
MADHQGPHTHGFKSWPEDARNSYLEMKARMRRLKAQRDALRVKGGTTPAVEAQRLPVSSLEELTLAWPRWMDGRIHRLKRGKHFSGDVGAVLEEARLAARVTGRGVLALREQIGLKYQYVWVQFTDHAVLVGDPCPCGGRKLARLHANLARCARCGKTLMLTPR